MKQFWFDCSNNKRQRLHKGIVFVKGLFIVAIIMMTSWQLFVATGVWVALLDFKRFKRIRATYCLLEPPIQSCAIRHYCTMASDSTPKYSSDNSFLKFQIYFLKSKNPIPSTYRKGSSFWLPWSLNNRTRLCRYLQCMNRGCIVCQSWIKTWISEVHSSMGMLRLLVQREIQLLSGQSYPSNA